MNWGHKIGIVIVLFVTGMLGLVFYASQQTNEMIDDNYYQKELAYQDVIDAKQNLYDLTSDNLIHQNVNEVFIILPNGAFEKLEKGQIEFLRTDSKAKDIHLPIIPNGSNRRSIMKTALSKGIYKGRISWTNNGKAYYKEESIFVE